MGGHHDECLNLRIFIEFNWNLASLKRSFWKKIHDKADQKHLSTKFFTGKFILRDKMTSAIFSRVSNRSWNGFSFNLSDSLSFRLKKKSPKTLGKKENPKICIFKSKFVLLFKFDERSHVNPPIWNHFVVFMMRPESGHLISYSTTKCFKYTTTILNSIWHKCQNREQIKNNKKLKCIAAFI